MDKFHDNSHQFDPYKNFKFRLQTKKGSDEDFVDVMGVSKIAALKKTVEIIEHREGGDLSTSHKTPGRIKYDAITLERCITQDRDLET